MSAQARMADALLRSVGGRQVLLRIPAAAVQGDLGEQVGLAVPEFQDLALRPVTFRKVRAKIGSASDEKVEYELLVSAAAVMRLVGSASAAVLFGTAAGVLMDEVLYQITSATSAEAFGTVYLYRLGLKGTAAGLV